MIDDTAKADVFSRHFESVYTSNLQRCVVPSYHVDMSEAMPPVVLSVDGIRRLIENLDVKKSCGPDGISGHVFRGCSDVISRFLFLLYEASLAKSVLPQDWKAANVIPIFKSGDKRIVENYRPISLLCIASKLLEHIIYSNLIKHLERNSFFSPFQHGFRTGCSCVTQLVSFHHDLALAWEEKFQTDCIF